MLKVTQAAELGQNAIDKILLKQKLQNLLFAQDDPRAEIFAD